jgi:hypothetical protein
MHRDVEIPVTRSTYCCTVAPSIRGYSMWNLLHITILIHRNLRWFLDAWKICGNLVMITSIHILSVLLNKNPNI